MRKNFLFFLALVVLFLPSFVNALWTEWKADKSSCGDVTIWERVCWKGLFGTECSPPYKVAICNPWQKPKRGILVTTWAPVPIYCEIDRDCLKTKIKVTKFLDGRGEVDPNEIHLPVKFYFEINDLPGEVGWGLSCGPTIKITTDSFERELSPEEAFSSKDFASVISERKRLDQLWAEGSLEELANFLIRYTHDNSLKVSQGKENFFANKYSENKKEFRSQTTSHRNYEKLQMGKEYAEVRKQIEYFIHFSEEFDVRGYFKSLDDDYCGHYGGRDPQISSKNLIRKVAYTYSPSQDRKIGPCKIKEGKDHWVKVQFCVPGKGCGPPDAPKIYFKTVDAPEPVAILAFSRKNVTKTETFTAKATRWIDTDWNGDGFPEIPKEFGADFVDFQFCGQEEIQLYNSPFDFRALYRGKKLIYDPNYQSQKGGCQKDPELQPLEEIPPERCVRIDKECLCDQHPQWCDKYCGKVEWIENIDICHPLNQKGPESLRIEKGKIENIEKFAEKNRSSNEEPNSSVCPPNRNYFFASEQGVTLSGVEEILIDWKDDPYYDPTSPYLNLPYPEDLWKWDFLAQYFPASPTVNVWQVQKKGSQYWSQKWHFKLTTDVPLKEVGGGKFEPMQKEDFEKTISFQPPYYPIKTSSGELGFNRLQSLEYEKIPRVLSYKVEVFTENGNPVKFLPIYTQIRARIIPGFFQVQHKRFNLWEVWPCLKYPTREGERNPQKINEARLNKIYFFNIAPCLDEWGEICIFETKIKAKSTGAPPTEFFPPNSASTPVGLPRYLGIQPISGAASYILEINSQKEFCPQELEVCKEVCIDPQTKKVTPCTEQKNYCPQRQYCWLNEKEEGQYQWKVRSCADVCDKIDDENYLHCGPFSELATFYGCDLSPPQEPSSPKMGEEFLPQEQVTFSWESGHCDNAEIFYELIVSYKRFPEETRQECQDLEGEHVAHILVPPENPVVLSNLECYGTYYWQIRKCLNQKCEESGRLSRIWYFNVVREKTPTGRGRLEGIGTCKKIVPDCPSEGCGLNEIPKLIFNILNCLLWTGIPVLIIIGIIATGLILIFFATNIDLMERVKITWKGFGIGILIMLFSWTLLNIIFLLLGWRREIFGDWFRQF